MTESWQACVRPAVPKGFFAADWGLSRIPNGRGHRQNGNVQVTDTEAILDRGQLRNVTLDDPDLMKEILEALMEDTSLHLAKLAQAVREEDTSQCARVAHYCKGACANVGARRAAAALLHVERRALAGDIEACAASLAPLSLELELLQGEAARALSLRERRSYQS